MRGGRKSVDLVGIEAGRAEHSIAQSLVCEVCLEVGDERQVLLRTQEHVGSWTAERIDVDVIQTSAGHRHQISTRGVPGVRGVDHVTLTFASSGTICTQT